MIEESGQGNTAGATSGGHSSEKRSAFAARIMVVRRVAPCQTDGSGAAGALIALGPWHALCGTIRARWVRDERSKA